MYKLTVAFRYMRRNWLNYVAILAVAIGVVVLICVLSVMTGFSQEMRARLRETLSDLIIDNYSRGPFTGYKEMMAKIGKLPHVKACAPEYTGFAIFRPRPEHEWRPIQFRGIDLERELATTQFAEYWRKWWQRQGLEAPTAMPEWGKTDDPKQTPAFAGGQMLILGRDKDGNEVKLPPGSELLFLVPQDLFGERQVFFRCSVSGGFHSGLYDFDYGTIYVPLNAVQRRLDKDGHVTSINVRLTSFDKADEVRDRLLGILSINELEDGVRRVESAIDESDKPLLIGLKSKIRTLREKRKSWFLTGNSNAVVVTRDAMKDLYTLIGRALRAQISGDRPLPEDQLKQLEAFKQMSLERHEQSIGVHFRVRTWESMRVNILRAVDVERRIMGFILFFVLLIAGTLVLTNVHTTVLSKTKDIGILKALGGSVRGIMQIFLLNGFLMGLIGGALGTAAGFWITSNINEIEGVLTRITGFKLFPPNIYYLDHIPVDKEPFWSIAFIWAGAIVVSLLASAYPAWRASRMDPVGALRYE